MATLPSNGFYLTNKDFPEWGEMFSDIYPDKERIINSNYNGILTKHITFVVTEKCNLRCTYCYESHECHKNGERMTKEVAKQAIDFIFDKELINGYYDFETSPSVIIEFIGGEPLLEIELIDFICDYFKFKAFELNHPWAYNYCFSMTTNGTLYFNDKVQDFIKKNKGKISFGITLDGNKQLHDSCRIFSNGMGSYDIVEKAVKHNIEASNCESTKLTLSPWNIEYMVDAFKHCWTLMPMIHANCVYENVWEQKHSTILYNSLKELADHLIDNDLYDKNCTSMFDERMGEVTIEDKNHCGGNGQMLTIGPDGVCYPCLRFMKHSLKEGREPIVCGDIWNGLKNPKENATLCDLCAITLSSQSPKKCLECKVSANCGLCTAYNYDEFGDPNKRATNICETHKAEVLANFYFWNKLYKKLGMTKRKSITLDRNLALAIISEDEYNLLVEMGGK